MATTRQTTVESGIVARARETGAPALAGPELVLAGVELIAAGLGVDQVDAVMETPSSGRRGDVLIGPAGTGKSRGVLRGTLRVRQFEQAGEHPFTVPIGSRLGVSEWIR